MKRITLEELLSPPAVLKLSYPEQYEYVKGLIEKEQLKPVKASPLNGKSPALHLAYWVMEQKKDYSALKEELLYKIVPEISIQYYLAHPENYEKDRKWVLCLNTYLKENKAQLRYTKSINERSFEIWSREKFLSREQGKKILKRCQIRIEDLNVYETTEPLAYYSHTRRTPQNILIVENKDTFFSMRKCLLEQEQNRQGTILGVPIGTLIYGAGKGIFKTFSDFDLCVEPYMKAEGNVIYYFGDLDYEGIGIYEGFAKMYCDKWEIKPFLEGYYAMLKKAEDTEKLPDTKEGQNTNIQELFFSYFPEETKKKMKEILETGRYIPQEILNGSDF